MRADIETEHWQLGAERLIWLTVATLLVLLPHIGRIPLWISACFLAFAGWRVHAAWRGSTAAPSTWLIAGMSLLMLLGVFLSYGSIFGRLAGVALLVILSGMKLMETRGIRDAYVVVYLGYFLVVTNFLYSQSIPTGIYMFVVVWVLTATLVTLSTPSGALDLRARLRVAGAVLVQAVPVMLVLFILFPRVAGPLWGLPKDAAQARSGLSSSMSPGMISQLTLSDEVAFRVKFDGDPPPAAALYWRGPVLWATDGLTWRTGFSRKSSAPLEMEKRGPPIDYVVTIEPHQQRWLFGLDIPATIPSGAVMTSDYQLHAGKLVRERFRYRVRSYTDYILPNLAGGESQRGLQLPENAHPRARAMAAKWRRELPDDAAIVDQALAFYRQQPFFYTLNPPLLNGDTVDEFLFETRRGFCEHFSASFTVLMRASGIPARVVTGYQGGELNPLGDYMIVRQRDAHAWTEVWLEGRGWVRVDPTAAVSPDRIERGMDATIPPTIGAGLIQIRPSAPVQRFWKQVRRGWDSVNNSWNQWVLGYGPGRQRQFLANFGIDAEDLSELVFGLVFTLSAGMALVAIYLFRTPGSSDRVLRHYLRFCRKLSKLGISRNDYEGPKDFADRASAQFPQLATQIHNITDTYISLRYAGHISDSNELRRAVSAFQR